MSGCDLRARFDPLARVSDGTIASNSKARTAADFRHSSMAMHGKANSSDSLRNRTDQNAESTATDYRPAAHKKSKAAEQLKADRFIHV